MEHLDKIIEMAEAELGAIAKNGKFKSREEIDSIGKLIDMTKDAYCIWDMEESMYGEDGMSYARDGRSMNRGNSYHYDGGDSYARGRRNARRDSMGRYSRNSYRGGYSTTSKDDYVEHLRDMMEDAPDDQTRQSIQRMIQKMEQA